MHIKPIAVVKIAIRAPDSDLIEEGSIARRPGTMSKLENALPKPRIELYSGKYFAACAIGGIIACGPTHTAVTPLDLVKTRRQVDSKLYKSNVQAWSMIYRNEGVRGVFFGWSPTFVGYCLQGGGKYGFYEVFKYLYGEKAFPNMNKTAIFLGASASAEFLADIALCPFEAIKVRMQTTLPPFANTMREGFSKVIKAEGYAGLYKGLYPLWGRQIPYTMCKFATFETTVDQIYKTLGKPKAAYNGLQQTGVSFLGGYIAGIACLSSLTLPTSWSQNSTRRGKPERALVRQWVEFMGVLDSLGCGMDCRSGF